MSMFQVSDDLIDVQVDQPPFDEIKDRLGEGTIEISLTVNFVPSKKLIDWATENNVTYHMMAREYVGEDGGKKALVLVDIPDENQALLFQMTFG